MCCHYSRTSSKDSTGNIKKYMR